MVFFNDKVTVLWFLEEFQISADLILSLLLTTDPIFQATPEYLRFYGIAVINLFVKEVP